MTDFQPDPPDDPGGVFLGIITLIAIVFAGLALVWAFILPHN